MAVNSVHLGFMAATDSPPGEEPPDRWEFTPLRRAGQGIEVAYGVLYLASDEASFVIGTEFVIDGGFIAR